MSITFFKNVIRVIPNGFTLLGLLCYSSLTGAVQPADGAVLNYTQVMFEFDEVPGADVYVLSCHAKGSGEILRRRISSLACAINSGLNFGGQYQWFYEAFRKGKLIYKSKPFDFSIAQSFLVVRDQFRYNVLSHIPDSFENNLLFIDYLGVAINRQGEPVWYMPYDSAVFGKVPNYRNLTMTKNGTFTFLKGEQCFEKSMEGLPVWQGPSDGKVSAADREWYHHDFLKSIDGTYYVCSYQYDSTENPFNRSEKIWVRYNTIIGYNNEGQVRWSWNEKDHVPVTEILKSSGSLTGSSSGTHMNGFAWNEKEQYFIMSFRNNSTLLKVDKKTGKIMYRLRGDEGDPFVSGSRFYGQHSPGFTRTGDVILYNNNAQPVSDKTKRLFPKVMLMQIPQGKATPRLLWEYECVMKEYPDGWVGKEGYAEQLNNKNILICVGGANKLLEVTPGKKVVWEMNCELHSSKENKWVPFSNYRSHCTSSLYPQYFTVQQPDGRWEVGKQNRFSIKLNNDGTDTDTYTIEWFSNNVFKPFSTTVTVKPGVSVLQIIPLVRNRPVKKEGTKIAVLRVSSGLNPTGVKDYTVKII